MTYYSTEFHWWGHCKDGSAIAEGTGSSTGIGYEGSLFEISTEIAGESHLHLDGRAQGRDLTGTFAGLRVAGEINVIFAGAGVSGAVLFDLDDLSMVLGYEASLDIGISIDEGLVSSLRRSARGVAGSSGLGSLVSIAKGLLTPDLGVYGEYLVLDYSHCSRE